MSLLTSPTLQNLITDTRTLLNQRDPTNSFWKDSEISDYLNEGVRMYFVEATMADEGYFTTQSDLNIVSGTETIALPTDCFKVKNVWKKVTNGFIVLPYQNSVTSGYSTQGAGDGNSYLPSYYFQGNNLVFRPTPQFSETAGIRIEYIQFPDNMVWGGDSLTAQVSPIFKQLIVMYAVYKCKLKESLVNGVDMHTVAASNLGMLAESFKNSLPKRSFNPTYVIPFNPETDF